MSRTATRRRLERLSAEVRSRNHGMHKVPASQVLTGDNGIERRLVRLLRHNKFMAITEALRKQVMGDDYVPTWEASREDRVQWNNAFPEIVSRITEHRGDQSETNANHERERAKLLKRRRKAEIKTGRPVAFLLPFTLSALSERHSNGWPKLAYDPLNSAYELEPVYEDGSTGDPSLYPIMGRF